MNAGILFRALKAIVAFAICLSWAQSVAAEPGCRNGGIHIANAFARANPLYELYFGDLASYLRQNQAQFREGGDAIRCTAALSRAFMSGALQLYDPADMQRKQEIDAQMELAGFKRGGPQPTASGILFQMSMNLSRLARVLPAASRGDYGPWNTPTNEIEQMQLVAERILRDFLRDPAFRSMFAPYDALFREAAEFDRQFVFQATQRLAKMP